MNLVKKRFLITQPMMHWICGSTVVTLELAEFLQSQGAEVIIYTCYYDDPIRTICKRKKIKVDDARQKPKYKLTDFDFIWVHSQVMPRSIIEALGKKLPSKMPHFLFLHMSGMDWIPDEKPWIYNLENLLSSKSLFISEEVKDVNMSMLDKKVQTGFFRNPAPVAFQKRKIRPKKQLQDILVVSNHPPKEVIEANKILETQYNLHVQLLGEGQDKCELFNSKILENFDAVITIAKTTQYCLISGTPVYVYDMFSGGVGWLNAKNFQNAKYRNFSGYQNKFFPDYVGKGFHKKTPHQIAEEVVKGYQDALNYHTNNQPKFQEEFRIDNVIETILADIKHRTVQTLPEDYKDALLATQLFVEKRFEEASTVHNLYTELNQLHRANDDLQRHNKDLQDAVNAKSYKLYNKLITPYKKLQELKKTKNQPS